MGTISTFVYYLSSGAFIHFYTWAACTRISLLFFFSFFLTLNLQTRRRHLLLRDVPGHHPRWNGVKSHYIMLFIYYKRYLCRTKWYLSKRAACESPLLDSQSCDWLGRSAGAAVVCLGANERISFLNQNVQCIVVVMLVVCNNVCIDCKREDCSTSPQIGNIIEITHRRAGEQEKEHGLKQAVGGVIYNN